MQFALPEQDREKNQKIVHMWIRHTLWQLSGKVITCIELAKPKTPFVVDR